jgi:NADPH:quinone reductase-like Zn-dependent oxidoreductase
LPLSVHLPPVNLRSHPSRRPFFATIPRWKRNYLKAKPEDFRELANLRKLVQENKFQVIIDRIFPLAEARAAQRHLEGRGHFGKVILKMS